MPLLEIIVKGKSLDKYTVTQKNTYINLTIEQCLRKQIEILTILSEI